MKNSITIFLLIISFSHETYSMKRHRTSNWHTRKKITPLKMIKPSGSIAQLEQPVLPLEIIKKICIDLFRRYQNVLTMETNIRKIGSINKQLRTFICQPRTICTIINNVGGSPFFDFKASLANQIKIKPIQNYLLQSTLLNLNIISLNSDQIKKSIINGADVNYCNSFIKTGTICKPILLKTKTDHRKTQLLLEFGADPHLTDKPDQSSAFGQAIRKKKSELLKLYISYCPQYCKDYLEIILATANSTIIRLILQQKNIPEIHQTRLAQF